MTAEFMSGLIVGPVEVNHAQLMIQRRASAQEKKSKATSIRFKALAFEGEASTSSRRESRSNSSPHLQSGSASTTSGMMRSFRKSIRNRMSQGQRSRRRSAGVRPDRSMPNIKFPLGGIAGVYDISRLIFGKVYNKLKPDDPDKVVDIESQDEQVGYEFSTTQIKEFRKVFNAFDRDGNDSIGTEELGPVLNALGYSPSDLDIQKVLSRFDADHSGDLSFEEYLALMAVWVEEDETQIIEAFKVFDKSGDGFVTITELKRALCRFGEKFSEEEADEFFALIDVNKDGIINYEEFVKYMLSEINRGPPPRQVKT
ncbi:myosin light chain 1, skeletal muscle isoform-like isoform X1 [Bolinopsis microptera]|uniref:myosin light chain 1, skeletal muscle isoform-like isoform X1 n=1 Tax=Bolinopsis microptera TaxID=2820187 RepID=UPI00307A23F8